MSTELEAAPELIGRNAVVKTRIERCLAAGRRRFVFKLGAAVGGTPRLQAVDGKMVQRTRNEAG